MNDRILFIKRALQASAIGILIAATLSGCGGGDSAGAAGSPVSNSASPAKPANGG
jgi:hypothetical protein